MNKNDKLIAIAIPILFCGFLLFKKVYYYTEFLENSEMCIGTTIKIIDSDVIYEFEVNQEKHRGISLTKVQKK